MSLTINEIFVSIDGEGLTAGQLTTFVRLAGCNLRCAWCDTAYSLQKTQGKPMSVQEVADSITTRAVTLTGGEPLAHKETVALVRELIKRGHKVNVETNGSKDILPLLQAAPAPSLLVTMDWKLPSSGMERHMLAENLHHLRKNDVLKLVIGSQEDLQKAREIVQHSFGNYFVYLSPVFGAIEPVELVEALKRWHAESVYTDRVRVQVQLHKIIWEPERRGV